MDGLDDIEDLFKDSSIDIASNNFRPVKLHKKREKKLLKTVEESRNDKALGDYFQETGQIPGTQSIFIKTWGCTHNTSDSEFMAGLLASYGYRIIDDKMKADLWILNSCTVKNPAEDHLRNEIDSAKSEGKYVVVAGCVSQAAPHSSYLHKTSLVGVQQIDRIVEVVEETLKGSSVRLLGNKKVNGVKQGGAPLTLPKIRRNPLIEIIPISTGCLNHCTYCKTKHARGELGSYPIDAIVERAIQAFEEGVCELWVTSEDTGAYGRDIGTNLPELLQRLVKEIPEGSMMRLGMTNPPYILDHMEAMAEILNHPKVYSFLHIPVQSGSDCVLGDMKREYTSKDFCNLVDYLRKHVPNINIVTDIICGFPTESEKDFQDSLDLCDRYRFASLYINQFYPRPGTPAANMTRINTMEVKRRTKQLTNFFQSYQPYDGRVGKEYDVLITEVAHDNIHLVGHNKFYEQILIPLDKSHLGTRTRVKIVSFGRHFMVGEVIRNIERASVTAPLPSGKVSGLDNFLALHGFKISDNKSHWLPLSFIVLISALLIRWICFIWQNKI